VLQLHTLSLLRTAIEPQQPGHRSFGRFCVLNITTLGASITFRTFVTFHFITLASKHASYIILLIVMFIQSNFHKPSNNLNTIIF
jgi:hypothetical protein